MMLIWFYVYRPRDHGQSFPACGRAGRHTVEPVPGGGANSALARFGEVCLKSN
jgi:hypothetical protein